MKKSATVFVVAGLSLWLLSPTGCETQRQARLQAQQAYVAGQEQVLEQSRPAEPVVTVHGPVRNSVIPWTEDLTLAKAINAADYTGYLRPRFIRVTRKGETTEVKTSQLLNGQDMPLQAGDIVEVVP
ncbi:MAG: hypothetical protein ABSF38_08915 [Verrucomicrobiota bacterium]|jgi:hypothetical protein